MHRLFLFRYDFRDCFSRVMSFRPAHIPHPEHTEHPEPPPQQGLPRFRFRTQWITAAVSTAAIRKIRI